MKSTRRISRRRRVGVEPLEGRALLTAGALDPTFGAGAGYVKTDLGTTGDSGKIVAAGNFGTQATGAVTTDFTLVRYNTDGTLDTTFGNGGVVKTDFNKGS